MKIFIISILLITSSCIAMASERCKIVKVIDGDTLQIESPEEWKELKFYLRLNSIDTPEKGKKARCDKEAELGEKATIFTTRAIKNGKIITCEFIKHDKYGGRILGNVYINGKSLSALLISNGLAKEYYGKKKDSWCE